MRGHQLVPEARLLELQLVVELAQRQQPLPELVLKDLRQLLKGSLQGGQLRTRQLELAAGAGARAVFSHGLRGAAAQDQLDVCPMNRRPSLLDGVKP